ncbi:unnamed protein product [Acanthoscelides obtectus]|uniref:DDE Tnp4 domain-containing protein n=1 Tax=Acanthoscelides obtectus TaxID=200917 RepID=A0A9P0Q6P7_ACAOB|nr:unnamed protein product [Acanthoscelides obtectus]CAK1650795.1 hypothetical protein AOBTE_LOCUS16901 [Acanthoscelides obtectus]
MNITYRFNRENVEWFANHFLDDNEDPVETRGGALSPTRKMEIFLRSLGDPGFQQGVAVDLDVNQRTVSRTLISEPEAIYCKRNNWITFPNTNDLLGVAINEWANTKRMHRIMYNNVQGAALLGDEGYGISPWLLTPFKNPTTPIQENYKLIHAKERCVIERCFGQLKRRFPMLHDFDPVQMEVQDAIELIPEGNQPQIRNRRQMKNEF